MNQNLKEINQILGFDHQSIRPKSMIITIMGDVVSVHGGDIWGGNLVKLNELFGITKHAARISLQRLCKENWLVKKKIKNKKYSYYSFSQPGLRTFETNYQTIYLSKKSSHWKNKWQILIVQGREDEKLKQLIPELKWIGFGRLVKNVFIAPHNTTDQLEQLIAHHKMSDRVLILSSLMNSSNQIKSLEKLVSHLWPMEHLIKRYDHFYHQFQKMADPKLLKYICFSSERAFYVRLKLIHEYRRLILQSPKLPYTLEKKHLPHKKVYNLCCEFYQALSEASMPYITQELRSIQGNLPKANPSFYRRFNPEIKTPSEVLRPDTNNTKLKEYT